MGLRFIDSIILYSANIECIVDFYKQLGLPLKTEEHEEGPVHFACEFGNAHIAFYETARSMNSESKAIPRGYAGAIQLGFRVESVEETLKTALNLGGTVLVEPQTVPWGRRAVFVDPDGRSIEINQA